MKKPNTSTNILMTLTPSKLRQAAEIREKISTLEQEFEELTSVTPNVVAPKRFMSAAARRKIGAAQRKRWKAIRAAKART